MENIKITENIIAELFGKECLHSGKESVKCAVVSSGCKLNQFESGQLFEIFKRFNISAAEYGEPEIDFFLINTCTVTDKADTETERTLRKIKKRYPESRLIITGCSAQINKDRFSDIAGLKIMDNVKKAEIIKNSADEFPNSVFNQKRTRPYLKIQEGCGLKCSYCIIPKARPVKWSLEIKNVLRYIDEFGRQGFREIILTGVNIGSYKDKKSGAGLKELLIAAEELKSGAKIRISSIDPIYIDDEMIKIFAGSKKIRNHFHIPLQSASDGILKLMKRNYSFNDYLKITEKICESVPDAAIGTDIISGFPGETEEDFYETVKNLEKLPIYYIHAFSYSDRERTESYFLKPKIKESEIKRRTGIIREISLQKKIKFHNKFCGKTLEFLSLTNDKAISSNYIKAKISGNPNLAQGTEFKGKIIDIGRRVRKDEVSEVTVEICDGDRIEFYPHNIKNEL